MQIGILEPYGFSAKARERLAACGHVADFDGHDLDRFLADKDILFVRLAHRIDAAFLARAPRLRILCSPTTGHTHVDAEALAERNIHLLSLRGEAAFLDTIQATPEHTLGLILALLRNYRLAFLSRDNDHWDRDRCRGEELAGMPVGLIGYGRVGRKVAGYLLAFGAKIGWYDPHVAKAPVDARRFGSALELIAASRLVILAASHTTGMPPLVDRASVAALDGKYFVNVARGELVDEPALLAAIEGDRLAGCAVDVIRDEIQGDSRARWIAATRRPNVIVTPHIGGATHTSMEKTELFISGKLQELLSAGAAADPAGAQA